MANKIHKKYEFKINTSMLNKTQIRYMVFALLSGYLWFSLTFINPEYMSKDISLTDRWPVLVLLLNISFYLIIFFSSLLNNVIGFTPWPCHTLEGYLKSPPIFTTLQSLKFKKLHTITLYFFSGTLQFLPVFTMLARLWYLWPSVFLNVAHLF